VLDNAPTYTSNLAKASQTEDQNAQSLETRAAQAERAAGVMGGFAKTLQQRVSNIRSLDEKSFLSATTPRPDKDNAYSVGDDSRAADEAAAAEKTERVDSSPSGPGLSTATARSGPAPQRRYASLSERLREILAQGAGSEPGKFGSLGKPAFHGEEEQKEAAGALAKLVEDAAHAGGSGGAPVGAFSLAGSETDRAVTRLMTDESGQGSTAEENIFGDVDQTIFQRMSKYLVKAQVDKRLGSR
jgi:hypothetical protein